MQMNSCYDVSSRLDGGIDLTPNIKSHANSLITRISVLKLSTGQQYNIVCHIIYFYLYVFDIFLPKM